MRLSKDTEITPDSCFSLNECLSIKGVPLNGSGIEPDTKLFVKHASSR